MSNYANRKYDKIIDIKDDDKIDMLLNLIPQDVNNIIDVGCGNGLITNVLTEHYDVLGVDINPTKLKHVKTNTLVSSCNDIPASDQDYDLVFSSELLEHLDNALFQSTLTEFQRLAKKYIIITVPNQESLEKLMVKCASCNAVYHKNGHLHNFNSKNIGQMFPSFNLVRSFEFGPKIRSYNSGLAKFKRKLTPPESWISKLWSRKQGVNYSYCLQCGAKNEVKHQFHPVAFSLDVINLAFSRKNKSQLIALFERSNS